MVKSDARIVSIDEFRELCGKQDAPECVIRTQHAVEVEAKADAEETRRLTFTISTESVDRDRDVVKLDGWDLTNYQKNPVVLWAHNYRQIPVGRSLRLWVEDGKLKSDTEFTPKGLDEFNDVVFELYRRRFMRATSVGFLPKKWNWSEDRKNGIDFEAQELLEYSMVPVPANPDALMEARSAGIDVSPLKKWAESTMALLKTGGEPQIDVKALAAEISESVIGALRRDRKNFDTTHATRMAEISRLRS